MNTRPRIASGAPRCTSTALQTTATPFPTPETITQAAANQTFGETAAAPNVWVAAACVIVSGVGNGVAVVCNAVLVQRGAPDAMRGRVFTVLMSSNYAVLGLGMVLAGPLTNEFGARWVWGVSACLSALAALVGYGLARGIRSPVIEAQIVKAGT